MWSAVSVVSVVKFLRSSSVASKSSRSLSAKINVTVKIIFYLVSCICNLFISLFKIFTLFYNFILKKTRIEDIMQNNFSHNIKKKDKIQQANFTSIYVCEINIEIGAKPN